MAHNRRSDLLEVTVGVTAIVRDFDLHLRGRDIGQPISLGTKRIDCLITGLFMRSLGRLQLVRLEHLRITARKTLHLGLVDEVLRVHQQRRIKAFGVHGAELNLRADIVVALRMKHICRVPTLDTLDTRGVVAKLLAILDELGKLLSHQVPVEGTI